MNEEVKEIKPHVNLVELKKWTDMAEELKQLKVKEAALRMRIFKSIFVEPKEGTNKFNLPADYVLKATLPINRKVDIVAFEAMKQKLIDSHIKADKLVQFKPELSISQYRTLDEEELKLVDQFLIISEGSPQMEIVLPKIAQKEGAK